MEREGRCDLGQLQCQDVTGRMRYEKEMESKFMQLILHDDSGFFGKCFC